MASRFEIVDKEYIEESTEKSEKENTKNSTERLMKLPSKFKRVRERCPRLTIVAVLSIQKFNNSALYVIKK